jgi:hypothetical protein
VHTASANRIAWFLRLQRIFRFPKYFLAPRPALPHRPRSVTDNLEPARSTGFRLIPQPVVPASRSWATASGYQAVKSRRDPAGCRAAITARAAVVAPGASAARQLKLGGASWIAAPAIAGAEITENRALASTKSIPGYSRFPRRTQRSLSVADDTSGSAGHRAIDDLATPSHGSDTRMAQLRAAYARPNRAGAEALLRAEPPPAGSSSDSDRGPSADAAARSFPNGARATTERKSEGPQATPGSTVHIDGSALGRWAIQHLERALAKPASGMTGVDPRANLPRGRVAPF